MLAEYCDVPLSNECEPTSVDERSPSRTLAQRGRTGVPADGSWSRSVYRFRCFRRFQNVVGITAAAPHLLLFLGRRGKRERRLDALH
jgi:hypothetical protein